jgi:hypothetical protein
MRILTIIIRAEDIKRAMTILQDMLDASEQRPCVEEQDLIRFEVEEAKQ